MKIVTAARMREIDQACVKRGIPVSVLMENAGKAVAAETRNLLGALKGLPVLCLVGAGNNGGDGLVAARYLHEWGAEAVVYLCSPRPAADENLKLLKDQGVTLYSAESDKSHAKLDSLLASTHCVIDALLGTGKMRPLEGVFKQVLEKVNAAQKTRHYQVVAVDLPSGLDADTGAVDPACPSADLTVTLAFPKPGLFLFPGAERVGCLKIVDITIPADLAADITTELLDPAWAASVLPLRPLNSNKGTFGRVMVGAGSANYIGAAYLACSGALRVGAGLVTLAAPASLTAVVASKAAEVTYLPLPESARGVVSGEAAGVVYNGLEGYTAFLLGCGLGQAPSVKEYLALLLLKTTLPPLVLDADALNILTGIPGWSDKIPSNAVLTPHPGEMARLTGLSVDEVQKDRLGVALRYAKKWRRVVVLKGAFTIIAAPDGRFRVSPFANPGMASAGTGDVLAGAIAGLVGQGLGLYDAASLGVYLHAAAGEKVRSRLGDAGMIASDLLPALPAVIKELKNRA